MTPICAQTKSASAEGCEQFHIVNPPKQDGGTFYRAKTGDGDESVRKGYLRRGMIIRLIKKDGDVVEEFMKDQEVDKEFKYVKFIAPDGSTGFIRSSFVAPLNKIYPNQSKHIECTPEFFLVLPINPTKEVSLNNRPKSLQEALRKVHRFSRSEGDLVVSRGEKEKIIYREGGEETRQEFIDAIFVQDQVDAWRPRSVIIPASGEGKLFELIPLGPMSFTPVLQNDEKALMDKVKSFVKRLNLKEQMENDILRVFNKSCAEDVTIEGELGVGTPSWFGIKASISGKIVRKFPAQRRYDLNRYDNVVKDGVVEIDRVIRCQDETNKDWYISWIYVTSSNTDMEPITIAQEALPERVTQYFTTPDANLVSKRGRLALLALLSRDRLPSSDYFSAFAVLGDYLEQTYLKDLNLDRFAKMRLKSLLIRILADPNPTF
jgi:hypothetical protein